MHSQEPGSRFQVRIEKHAGAKQKASSLDAVDFVASGSVLTMNDVCQAAFRQAPALNCLHAVSSDPSPPTPVANLQHARCDNNAQPPTANRVHSSAEDPCTKCCVSHRSRAIVRRSLVGINIAS
jgi:hypothetical protein